MSKQCISSSSQDLFFNVPILLVWEPRGDSLTAGLPPFCSELSVTEHSLWFLQCWGQAILGRFWCHPQHRVQPQKPAACAAQTHDSEKHVKIRTCTARVKQVFKSFVAAELFGGLFLFQTPGEGTCKETTRCWWHLSKVRVQIARMFMFASTALSFFFQGMLKKDYPISDRFLLCHVPQNLCQRHQFPSPLQGREDLMHRAGCDIVVSKGKGGRLNRSRQILHIQRIYKRW